MASIFSSPLVHTVYYFRKVFSPAPPRKTEALKALVLREHGFGDRIRHKDFAFNEDVNCSNMANGIFMRLNACSLMKLRHWCLYPTESTPKKVAQYIGYIFLSPLTAGVDVVMNVALLILKFSAWPILRIAMRTDDLAKKCLRQNVCWHFNAVFESFANLVETFFESIICTLAGPRWTSRVDWCYSICQWT